MAHATFAVTWTVGRLTVEICIYSLLFSIFQENLFTDFLFCTDLSSEETTENSSLPKGDMWSVHKFGGTCMGTAERIQNVANIVSGDPSERKLVVVSAMSKVTDMMYNLVDKAQSRDDAYISALDDVYEKHMLTAKQLLHGDDLVIFSSQLHNDISNLKAMLRAIYIGLNSIILIILFNYFKVKLLWNLKFAPFFSKQSVRVFFSFCCKHIIFFGNHKQLKYFLTNIVQLATYRSL